MRGYNESDKFEERFVYVMVEFVKDIEEVIKELGYEKCILVGYDWGGVIVWCFGYVYLEMIEKLIIMNIFYFVKFMEGLGILE